MRLLFILLAGAITASAQIDDERLLNAIGQVESGMNRNAVGDHRNSLGAYQIGYAAWLSACKQLRLDGLPIYPRSSWRSPVAQDAVALANIRMIRARLIANGYPSPTVAQIAVCWNMGISGALRRGLPLTDYAFRVSNVYITSL
jgi:muramidase (phage lysozyme)